MAYVIYCPNPFEPRNHDKWRVNNDITIRGWLEKEFPGFTEFDLPTICFLNGQPLKREGWGHQLAETDVVQFIAVPQGPFIIIAILVVALALAVVFLAQSPVPKVPGEAPASDPVFSVKGQQNDIRLGEPVECNYGRNRIYPSLATRPYYQYVDNDQFQYSLMCIGQGEYSISEIRIGDTAIASYEEVQYEILGPGDPVTLFPTNVFTSAEAGGQELFAPNQDEYVAPGWVGPFPTNPAGTLCTKIQFDVILPKGLYVLPDTGEMTSLSISFEAQAQEIDNTGTPIGAWFPITFPTPFTITAATTTTQRKTFSFDVAAGRYQFQIRRTDTKNLSYKAGHDIVLEGLRGWVQDDTRTYGNKTMMAVVIRASNNLNDRTQFKFNLIATRKLPRYESGAMGTTLYATRSIIWAFVDAFRSRYGGRITDDRFFDWTKLLALDEEYTSRGDYFDWTFRDPITVWEAAQTIARVGRAVPLLIGSLISLRRDEPLEIPVAMFTPENMAGKNFEWSIKFWDLDEHDSVRIEYTEPATGYKQETVLCTLPGGTSDNPEDIRFAGIQSRAQAFREGMFILATKRYVRENISFDAGLEGYIPTFGDLALVSHDMPNWGQSGYVVDAHQESDSLWLVWVSEPLIWGESGVPVIMFRGRRGEVIGPLDATQTPDPMQVLVDIGTVDSDFDFQLGGQNEPMLFLFGISGMVTKSVKVIRVEPGDGETVRMACVNDAPIIHSFDDQPVPPLNEVPLAPAAPDLPVMRGALYINQVDPTLRIIQVSWLSAFGAQYYIVQTSVDGADWALRATTPRTSLQLQAPAGAFYVRVSAVNAGQGAWLQASAVFGHLAGLDLLAGWGNETSWTIGWLAVQTVTGYRVRVYDHTVSAAVLKRTQVVTGLSFTYDYSDAIDDSNQVRQMRVEVEAMFSGIAAGDPVALEMENPIPSPPGGVAVVLDSVESDHISYQVSWTVPHENDLYTLRIWVSATSGFDPSITTPYAEVTPSAPDWTLIPSDLLVDIPLESDGTHDAQYVRVGLFDPFGNEVSSNLSAEITIPAYP